MFSVRTRDRLQKKTRYRMAIIRLIDNYQIAQYKLNGNTLQYEKITEQLLT